MSQVVNSFKEQYTRNRQKGGRAYGCSEVKVFKPNQTGKLAQAGRTAVQGPRGS